MKIGMLWLDQDQGESLDVRIRRASAYYREKYGRAPDLCCVHPRGHKDGLPSRVDSMEIRPQMTVLPGHFWIGLKEPKEAEPA